MPRLDKKERAYIRAKMENKLDSSGSIEIEDIMEIIEPFDDFEVQKLIVKARRERANSLLASMKNERGQRSIYSYKDKDKNNKYIDIDNTIDLESLGLVESHINDNLFGAMNTKERIQKRRKELLGQISFTDISNTKE